MVCDLRKINRFLKPFVTQISKIDQILNDIAAQNPIDIYKNYNSNRLSPKTNQLTVFLQSENLSKFCMAGASDGFISIKRCICLRHQ